MKNILENYKKFSTSYISILLGCDLFSFKTSQRDAYICGVYPSVGNVVINLVKCQDFKNSFRKLKMIFVRNFHHYTF